MAYVVKDGVVGEMMFGMTFFYSKVNSWSSSWRWLRMWLWLIGKDLGGKRINTGAEIQYRENH